MSLAGIYRALDDAFDFEVRFLWGYNPACKVTPVILHGVVSTDHPTRACVLRIPSFVPVGLVSSIE